MKNSKEILDVVSEVPVGSVATYGQIAQLAGFPRNAREVGSVLKNLPDDSDVPWHRIVNSQGRISDRGESAIEGLQQHLLEEEGVEFEDDGRVSLAEHQWKPNSD